MKLFIRKLRRDLRRVWPQFLAVALMAALSVLVFSGLEGGWRGIQTQLDAMSQSGRMPDAWVIGAQLNREDAAQLEARPGVDQAVHVSTVVVKEIGSRGRGTLLLSPQGSSQLNAPYILEGSAALAGNDILIDAEYARAHQLRVGDSVTLPQGDQRLEVRIRAIVIQPDKIAYTGNGLVAPNPDQYGYGIVSAELLGQLTQSAPAAAVLLVKGDPNTVRSEAPALFGDRYSSVLDRDSHPFVSTAYERVAQIRSLSYLFSSLFLVVALLSIFTSIRRLTDTQQGEIAILKALGYSNRAVGAYFTAVGAVAVCAGMLVGLACTPALSAYVLSTQRTSFALPNWVPNYALTSGLLPAVLLVVCMLGSWSATRPVRRATPAEGMRPESVRGNARMARPPARLLQRLPVGSRWGVRDAVANPGRLAMGLIATCGCMMLLIAGFGMPDTLNTQVRVSFERQYQYSARLAVSPLSSTDVREQLAEEAGPGQWIQQTPVRVGTNAPEEHLLTVLGEGDLFRVAESGDQDPIGNSDDALITENLSAQLGLHPGDDITISLPDGATHDIRIDGIARVSEPLGVILSEGAWIASGGLFTPTDFLTRDPPPENTQLLPGVTAVLELSEQRDNAQALVDSLTSVFTLIKAFAILLAVVVLYNLGALSFTERIREYATLRVLGFHLREIRSMASHENIIITLAGWALGVPAGWWFLGQYVGLFSTDRAQYFPYISLGSLGVASAVTVCSALTATLLLTRRVRRIEMAEALKGVE